MLFRLYLLKFFPVKLRSQDRLRATFVIDALLVPILYSNNNNNNNQPTSYPHSGTAFELSYFEFPRGEQQKHASRINLITNFISNAVQIDLVQTTTCAS